MRKNSLPGWDRIAKRVARVAVSMRHTNSDVGLILRKHGMAKVWFGLVPRQYSTGDEAKAARQQQTAQQLSA